MKEGGLLRQAGRKAWAFYLHELGLAAAGSLSTWEEENGREGGGSGIWEEEKVGAYK